MPQETANTLWAINKFIQTIIHKIPIGIAVNKDSAILQTKTSTKTAIGVEMNRVTFRFFSKSLFRKVYNHLYYYRS